PIWAKPRAAPPPSASPMIGRRIAPNPTLSVPSALLWPRPVKISNIETLPGPPSPQVKSHTMRGSPPPPVSAGSMVYAVFDGVRRDLRQHRDPDDQTALISTCSVLFQSDHRLEFAVFSVKSRFHDNRGRWGWRFAAAFSAAVDRCVGACAGVC